MTYFFPWLAGNSKNIYESSHLFLDLELLCHKVGIPARGLSERSFFSMGDNNVI